MTLKRNIAAVAALVASLGIAGAPFVASAGIFDGLSYGDNSYYYVSDAGVYPPYNSVGYPPAPSGCGGLFGAQCQSNGYGGYDYNNAPYYVSYQQPQYYAPQQYNAYPYNRPQYAYYPQQQQQQYYYPQQNYYYGYDSQYYYMPTIGSNIIYY